jgi:hypothetical protein
LRRLIRDCSGAVAIEFLIVSFPLVLLLLGTFDIGLLMLTKGRINFAVEAAAKCGAIGATVCASPSGLPRMEPPLRGSRASTHRVFWSRRPRVVRMSLRPTHMLA